MSNSTTPDLSTLPHTNSGPTLLAVTWTLTGIATIFLALRLYCKLLGHRRLFWDDWILIAAWLTIMADASLTSFLIVDYDVGKHSWDVRPDENYIYFGELTNIRASIVITATVWTKTAFAVTLLRLTEGWARKLVWFIIITMNLGMGASALMPWLVCGKFASGAPIGGCKDINALLGVWISTSAYSGAMDFTLAAIPWTFLWHLQMRRKEKIGVAIAMSMGVIAGIVAIIKSTELPSLFTGDFYNQVHLFYWDITEASVTMMAACIPALRVLIRDAKESSSRGYKISEPNSTLRATRPQTYNSDTAPISSRGPWDGRGNAVFEMENKSANSGSSMA